MSNNYAILLGVIMAHYVMSKKSLSKLEIYNDIFTSEMLSCLEYAIKG